MRLNDLNNTHVSLEQSRTQDRDSVTQSLSLHLHDVTGSMIYWKSIRYDDTIRYVAIWHVIESWVMIWYPADWLRLRRLQLQLLNPACSAKTLAAKACHENSQLICTPLFVWERLSTVRAWFVGIYAIIVHQETSQLQSSKTGDVKLVLFIFGLTLLPWLCSQFIQFSSV